MAPFITRLMHYVHLVRRSHTLGVRAVVRDAAGRVLLVKHTYVPGWYLPGGGVDPGETLHDALEKELREEANIRLTGPARLVAVYHNRAAALRDHVALFDCPEWTQPGPPAIPNREILDAGFFATDRLPDETTTATLRRLKELDSAGPYDPLW